MNSAQTTTDSDGSPVPFPPSMPEEDLDRNGLPIVDTAALSKVTFTYNGEIKRLRPVRKQVFVRRVTEEETAGGLILPDSAQQNCLLGEVIGFADDCEFVQLSQQVFFARFSGQEVAENMPPEVKHQLDGVLVMNEADIVSIVEDVDAK